VPTRLWWRRTRGGSYARCMGGHGLMQGAPGWGVLTCSMWRGWGDGAVLKSAIA
jgi:hypothetical protein